MKHKNDLIIDEKRGHTCNYGLAIKCYRLDSRKLFFFAGGKCRSVEKVVGKGLGIAKDHEILFGVPGI